MADHCSCGEPLSPCASCGNERCYVCDPDDDCLDDYRPSYESEVHVGD